MDKILSLISLAKKAGKVSAGFEEVRHNILKKQVYLVLLSRDLSLKSQKNVRFICDKNDVSVLNIDTDMIAIGKHIGKKSGIVAIKDIGFAQAIEKAFVKFMEDADVSKI
jgi:ribosomal protein L7Ae-like RNA K-turn-binding protein